MDIKNMNYRDVSKKFLYSFLRITIAVFVLGFILFFIKLPYNFEAPGGCNNAASYVNVENPKGKTLKNEGFYITTVLHGRASIIMYLWALIDNSVKLTPLKKKKIEIPRRIRHRFMKNQMEISKIKAKIAAFKVMDYDVQYKMSPLEICAILPQSKAKKILKVNDKILMINKEKIKTRKDILKVLKKCNKNELINIVVIRKNKKINLKFPLININGKNMMGIMVISQLENVNIPKKVIIRSGRIIGASAGLIFSLEIIRQVSGVNMAGGKKIAGTGVIDINGKVLPIAGAAFKVAAAEREKADYFFVPKKNYQEALKASKNIKVYPVKSLKETLKILKKINPKISFKNIKN